MPKKTYSTSDKKTQQENSSLTPDGFIDSSRDRLAADTWQAAIDFANQKIDQMKTMVKIFAEYRDTNHPFPGQSTKR